MRHNEHEIPMIEKIAKELNADRLIIKSVDIPVELKTDYALEFLPERSEYRRYYSAEKNENDWNLVFVPQGNITTSALHYPNFTTLKQHCQCQR